VTKVGQKNFDRVFKDISISQKKQTLEMLVLLQFSWRRGSKDARGQGFKGLFSKDFISAFNILSIAAMSFFSVPNSPFSIKSKSPANNICVSDSQTEP
jgi:hypothetical protein